MPDHGPSDRYPGYDVMAKRHTPSWNAQTRRVVDARLSLPNDPQFFTEAEWTTLNAICARIVPRPPGRTPIPVAAAVDHKMHANSGDGYRDARLPPMRDSWQRGLHALDQEARQAYGVAFHRLDPAEQDALLKRAQNDELSHPAWRGMPVRLFFNSRLVKDITQACYAFPAAWNEMGFGGPASPRGYVRMDFDERDPWEAAEVKDGDVAAARRENRRVG